ncbi:Protein of unknown function [Lentibacillus persicus]|uniref:DUF3311 domain-containing protein n=1 Tax=Lentibacillus persicus TaxID=640948 RepID=A0A1I2AKN5_9BACI|nr:DUF3311 domain-containing protein [Lentibacillus persicus]SFE44456.1 Protein of unknown function [Lentibacillus persicus]
MSNKKSKMFFHVAVIFGLIMLETPIVLMANNIEPVIFGMPFLVFWVLFWWFFCTIIFLIAYMKKWGKKNSIR